MIITSKDGFSVVAVKKSLLLLSFLTQNEEIL